jgi:transcription initiation factor TFIIIB Brf1 subunit/transcription initiation factor TFIIB
LQEKCPHCGKNPLVYDLERHEVVCPHCGLVIDDRPLVSVADCYKHREHGHRRLVFINVCADAWLHISLEIVRSMYKQVFFDTCTLKTAERVLADMRKSSRRLPDCEKVAKFAVLVASRRCGEVVELEKLFESVSEVYELLRHDYLRKLYAPPDRIVQIVQHALKIAKCLEERGVHGAVARIAEKAEQLSHDKLCTVSARPRNLAVVLVHSTLKDTVDLSEITECAGTKTSTIIKAIKRYSHVFS